MTQHTQNTRRPSVLARIARGTLWLLFATVLLVPKLIALRRRPGPWNVFRAIVAVIGVVLILAGLTMHARTGTAILGATLVLLGLLVVPERLRQSLDDRRRELGTLVVVNGGTCQLASGAPFKAELCVGSERVWVLDSALAVRIELSLASVADLRAEAVGDAWMLCLLSPGSTAELLYDGPFAEHFARVAESTVRSQLRRELPILR